MSWKLVGNASWLGVIQVANWILPLITVPYLARTLLPQAYGTMVFAIALAGTFAILTEYGFNWSGVQQAAANRHDSDSLRQLYSAILGAKTFLLLIAATILTVVVAVTPDLRSDWQVYAFAFAIPAGYVATPSWLFQGLERMSLVAMTALTARVASVAATLAFIHGPSDVALAVLLAGAPILLTGLAAQALVRRYVGRLRLPALAAVRQELVDGWPIFLSTCTVALYTNALILFVRAFGGPSSAAFYGSADRCMNAGKALLAVAGQAALPRVAYLSKADPRAGLQLVQQMLWLSPVMLIVSVVMFLFASQIANLLFGPAYVAHVGPLFRILSPIPFILTLSTCFATLYMFNFGHRRRWTQMLVAAGVVGLVAVAAASSLMSVERAAATGALASESFVCLVSAVIYFRSRWRFGDQNLEQGDLPDSEIIDNVQSQTLS
jgi:polysaccharide transporter, PST family